MRRNQKTTLIGIVLLAVINLVFLKFELQSIFRKESSETQNRWANARIRQPYGNESGSKNWNDEAYYKIDSARFGLGEQGKPVNLTNMDMEKVEKAYNIYAYNTIASAQIALDRSLPDVRHLACKTTKYLKKLPPVSVIIVFHNEHWTVIIRTIRSVMNRSPPELIHELILVDDASTVEDVADLQQYIQGNLPKVRVVRLSKRSGLIVARLTGARIATASILIFLDAHVEANYNWLPPLLEPIVKNPKTCVCPQVDLITYDRFEYLVTDNGGRGVFDWHFYYYRFPVLTDEGLLLPKPFRNPVMMGGLFAIGADFFQELGEYDDQLDIWGGEQFELSFKIWMCGGQMLDAPCSRFGHIFPAPGKYDRNPRAHDYLRKNLKRVAEVWMDEYKNYVYIRDQVYYQMDAGNLTKQHALRSRMNCKSFKWYLEEVAPEVLAYFPPEFPSSFASGTVRNDFHKRLCLDALDLSEKKPIGLYECAHDLVRPHMKQYWFLTYHHELRILDSSSCADSYESGPDALVYMFYCHGQGGNQLWKYDFSKKLLKHKNGENCLEADRDGKLVIVNRCDPNNLRMRWTFGAVNETLLRIFQSKENMQKITYP